MAKTEIGWTELSWNATIGCTKVSRGCYHCYAESQAKRLFGKSGGFQPRLQEKQLNYPRTVKKPSMIFVNSMSDLFHETFPLDYIGKVFDVMEETPWHTYQILTKRTKLMKLFINGRYPDGACPAHIWVGTSIEDMEAVHRLETLQSTRARVRFLSLEPLLGPLDGLDLRGIGWVIVGGESGTTPRVNRMNVEWIRSIRDQCAKEIFPMRLQSGIPAVVLNALRGVTLAEYTPHCLYTPVGQRGPAPTLIVLKMLPSFWRGLEYHQRHMVLIAESRAEIGTIDNMP